MQASNWRARLALIKQVRRSSGCVSWSNGRKPTRLMASESHPWALWISDLLQEKRGLFCGHGMVEQWNGRKSAPQRMERRRGFFRGELRESVGWLSGRNSFYMGKRLGSGGAFLVPQEQGYFGWASGKDCGLLGNLENEPAEPAELLRLVWLQLRVAKGAIFPHHLGPLWAAGFAAAFPGAFPAEWLTL